jgi:predicted nucleic acid-binding protein
VTFAQIPAGTAVFLDANTLIYHFASDATYGAACTQLLKRVEQGQLHGYTSAHALADVAHRLMTLEAIDQFGWLPKGIAARLQKRHGEIPKLTVYRTAIGHFSLLKVQVLPIALQLAEAAAVLSEQHELLTGDALVVAVMQANGLGNLASKDKDFDRVPGLVRFAPA